MMRANFIDKKGVIDQIITSVIVLFAVFFLMAIFVIVSGNIGEITGTSNQAKALASGATGSRVLADLFLSDEMEIVSTDEMARGGQGKSIVRVVDALTQRINYYRVREGSGVPQPEAIAIFKPLEDFFDKSYSCDGQNELLLIASSVKGDSKSIYMEYPSKKWSKGGEGLMRSIGKGSGNERGKFLYDLHESVNYNDFKNGLKNGYYAYHLKDSAYIFIKENKKC